MYKKTTVDQVTKDHCAKMLKFLNNLQAFVVKMRTVTVIREKLGTALSISCNTRWLSRLTTLINFEKSKVQIREVLTEFKPELLDLFDCFASSPELLAYIKVLEPVRNRVVLLEVIKLCYLI